ncbi:hypothetical protein H4217_006135 [Coemansia sp. RSA 1939]|nr:hypothetical protein H4217_006135 [Coemansia sp. RSA 1939]KAJ2614277.1 hypothetical protein EV177_002137 [Coemansia sp. RSA 1804]KAJ2692462.1 hypothetical protein GGH99_001714 [Coemansia sp. RSA 1285]
MSQPPSKKERVHFGTLEREGVALAKRKRQEEDTDNERDGENGGDDMLKLTEFTKEDPRDLAGSTVDLDLIDESLGDTIDDQMNDESLERRRQAMDEFERKKLARSIAVPTADLEVRAQLRSLDHPVCLFGEDAGDRRGRLRYILSKIAIEQKKSAAPGEPEDAMTRGDADEIEEEEGENEEFYTEGSEELRQARHKIAVYSLARAGDRLERQRKDCEADLAVVRQRRQNLVKTLQSYTNDGSQVGGERPLARIVFSADSKTLLVGSWSGAIKLWTVPQCKEVRTYRGHTDRVGGLSFRPQSAAIHPLDPESTVVDFASGAADKTIHLWSGAKETPVATLHGHANRVVHVNFHPSGDFLGSASYDGSWRLWDIATQRELLLQEGHSREVFCLRFQCDGSLVATAGLDGIGRVWDLRSGRSVMALEGHAKEIFGLDWSPNGFHVATGSADNTVRVFDLRKMESICQIPAHKSMITDVRFFHAASLPPALAAADGSDDSTMMMDTSTDRETNARLCSGQYLVSASNDGLVNVWTTGDWKLQKSLAGHVGKVMSVDVAGDGSYIASSGYDRTFKLWGPEDFA